MQDYNLYSRKKIPFFPSQKVFNTLTTREKTVVLDLKLILKYLINNLELFFLVINHVTTVFTIKIIWSHTQDN